MSSMVIKNTLIGLAIGLGLSVTAGSMFLTARAVAPATVNTPTFGPQDDDVVLNFNISCAWVGWSCDDVFNGNCRGNTDGGGGRFLTTDMFCDNGQVTNVRYLNKIFQ